MKAASISPVQASRIYSAYINDQPLSEDLNNSAYAIGLRSEKIYYTTGFRYYLIRRKQGRKEVPDEYNIKSMKLTKKHLLVKAGFKKYKFLIFDGDADCERDTARRDRQADTLYGMESTQGVDIALVLRFTEKVLESKSDKATELARVHVAEAIRILEDGTED